LRKRISSLFHFFFFSFISPAEMAGGLCWCLQSW
jgi:hypothetical protein